MPVIMLLPMRLVDQWRSIQEGLPEDWSEVRVTLTTEQLSDLPRAAQVLGAISAGRVGQGLTFEVQRSGANGAQKAAHLFQRLDDERTWCQIEASDVAVADAPAAATARELRPVAETWDAALAQLPSDWSDLLCEIEIYSSALLDRTALLCAPVNPTRAGSRTAFTFRCSSGAGYGVSAPMARRCFERVDADGIEGVTRVLRVLSDTDVVATQGPVWLVGGKML
jgi:hypothetical protein